jgi:sialate O-acetylesterase
MNILSGLANGQVLQRLGSKGAKVVINGTSAEDGPIRATLSKANAALKGWNKRPAGNIVRGKFSVKLASIPVGGPYSLRLEAGRQRVDVSPFFVGDVWIMAGQSNMEGVGNMTGKAKPHPLIRSFSMRREWRLVEDPLHTMAESPDTCHATVQCTREAGEELRRAAVKGVGVGLFFAREMLERSGGAPQGLISTGHGGTSMQQWSPDQKHLGGSSLYASMLTSVQATGQPVAGLLWYQGESDANPTDAAQYVPRMKKLVAASRRDLRQPRLPWIIVQLARLFSDPASPLEWNSIQEQQRLLPKKIKFFETAPAIDLPLDDHIHIGAGGFPRLAARLASAADRLVYGNKHETRTPQLRNVRVVDKPPFFTMEVAFDFVRGGLCAEGEPTGFKFVSPEGTPLDLIYKTELKGDTAKLCLIKKPTAGVNLFYGHGFAPRCNITDARGFSLPVFGPFSIGNTKPRALTPFITEWNVSEIIPASKKLDQVPLPDMQALGATVKSYPQDGFINEHNLWALKTGQTFFHSRLHLSEPMKLKFLMGYDGPFRLWLDGKPFFKNMAGINPCFPDESGKTASLEAGPHDLHVGMALNGGLAWGFFLRMARKDVTSEQIRTGEFAKPTYSA